MNRYGFYYAIIDLETGECLEVQDTTDYVLADDYVPISVFDEDLLLKYYYPMPQNVTSWDDFQGQFYWDSTHTQVYIPGAESNS